MPGVGFAPLTYIGIFIIQVMMIGLAGSALVPSIKGAHNWIVLGPVSIQPSEFYKIATLLMVAWLMAFFMMFANYQTRLKFLPSACYQRQPSLKKI